MFDVQGKRAIVTGGGRGIGKAMVRKLLLNSCKVCIADLAQAEGEATLKELQDEFGFDDSRVCFVVCDVTKKEDWVAMWQKAENALNGPIEILCNNAGVGQIPEAPEKTMAVNAVGASIGMYYALEKMSKSKGREGGRIINTASIASFLIPDYHMELGTYHSSKHAVAALTRFFDKTHSDPFQRDGVKCYALAPSLVETNMADNFLGHKYQIRGQRVSNVKEVEAVSGVKFMNPSRIADAMMSAFRLDKNGAIYCIFENGAILDYPCYDNVLFYFHTLLSVVAKKLFDMDHVAAWQAGLALFLVVWLSISILNCLLSMLF